jgi:hypothetical protein
MRIFETLYFGLCWNLRLVIELWYLEGFWFLLEDFFEDYIFAWWNIWVSIKKNFALRVNEVEKAIEINPQEVQDTFQIAQKKLAQVEGRKQVIEVNLALKRAKVQLEAIDATPPSHVPN